MKRLSDLDDELQDLNDDSDKHDDEPDDAVEEYDDEENSEDDEDDWDDEDDEDDYELPIAKFLIPVAAAAILLIIAIIVFIIATGRTTGKVMEPADIEEQIIEDASEMESEDAITDVTDDKDETTEDETADGKAEGAGLDGPENEESEDVISAGMDDTQSESTGTGQDAGVNIPDPLPPDSVPGTASNAEASMNFTEVNETVTAKDATNLRNIPSQGGDSTIVYTLRNGETATRTGISDSGWSRLTYDGQTVYAVSSYLTTDLEYHPPTEGAASGDGLKTKFVERNEQVTAKIEVNLRKLPSVTNPDAVVVAVLHHGDYVTRTGINEDVGWSRVVYNEQTLYCVSSYLTY